MILIIPIVFIILFILAPAFWLRWILAISGALWVGSQLGLLFGMITLFLIYGGVFAVTQEIRKCAQRRAKQRWLKEREQMCREWQQYQEDLLRDREIERQELERQELELHLQGGREYKNGN